MNSEEVRRVADKLSEMFKPHLEVLVIMPDDELPGAEPEPKPEEEPAE